MSGEVYSEGAPPFSRKLADDSAEFLSRAASRVESGAAVLWRRILLGIVLFEIPLQIDTYLFHNAEEARLGAISGFNVSLTTFCLALLYLQWLPGLIVASGRIQISKSLLAFLAITIFSIVWADNRNLAMYELFLLLQAFLVYTYVVNRVTTRAELIFVVKVLVFGVAIQGLAMGLTSILGANLEAGPLSFQIHNLSQRVCGSLGSPNVAGSYLALTLPICLCVLFAKVSRPLHNFTICALLAGCSGLVLTMSRGGWLATGFAFTLCFIVAFRRKWMSLRSFVLVSFALCVVAIPFQPILATRILGEDGGSAHARFPLYYISAMMIADHPQGVGANNWEIASRPYAGTSENRGEWFFTVHNKYLLIWVEAGLFGLLAFLVFLFSTIKTGWRTWRMNDRLLSPIALGCTAAIAGQMIHLTLDIFNSRVQVQMLWLVAAMVVVAGNLAGTADQAEGSLSRDE